MCASFSILGTSRFSDSSSKSPYISIPLLIYGNMLIAEYLIDGFGLYSISVAFGTQKTSKAAIANSDSPIMKLNVIRTI